MPHTIFNINNPFTRTYIQGATPSITQNMHNSVVKHNRSISSKYKKVLNKKMSLRKYNPNEDIETLKEFSDIIDFSVPEELIRCLKLMKY